MLIRSITFALVGFFVSVPIVQAMTSTNFEIRWDTVSTGGSDTGSSVSYGLRDTVESALAGTSTSTSFTLQQGYRNGVDDQIISFEVYGQNTALGREATALTGTTVTASTSSISIGELIVVVQNLGASQIVAIGRVISLGSGTITVDAWKNGGTQPTVDGTNDYVYPITSSSIALETLSTTSVTTSIVGFEVTAANENGYVVQVLENGNLLSGTDDVDDVSDGSVSVGSEEYGARSSDTTLSNSTFDTADSAITSTGADVATEPAAIYDSYNFLILKVGISSSTVAGSYTQILSVIVSGNF